jgi:hypothetical protein
MNLRNFVAKFPPNFRIWKRNWQVDNKLGNRALKSNMKSTIRAHVVQTQPATGYCDIILTISNLITQGRDRYFEHVEMYELSFSQDGSMFENYQENGSVKVRFWYL